MELLVKGQSIVRLYSLKSKFDGDCIGALLDTGEAVRIPIKEFNIILNDLVFDKEKKRTHTYLTVNQTATDTTKSYNERINQ